MAKVANRWQKLPKAANSCKNSLKVPKTGKVANKWQRIPRVAQKDGRSCQKMANVTNSCQKLPTGVKNS